MPPKYASGNDIAIDGGSRGLIPIPEKTKTGGLPWLLLFFVVRGCVTQALSREDWPIATRYTLYREYSED